MKIFILILLSIGIFGCNNDSTTYVQTKIIEKPGYELGEIVYIKPDSLKCVIIGVWYDLHDKLIYDVKFYYKTEIKTTSVKSFEIY